VPDTGSLPIAVLLTVLAMALSALLLPMVVTQVNATRAETERGQALHAARAGLEVMLGHIRAATDADGSGTLATLPCGGRTGRVGAGATARYRVTVDYFAFDPKGRPDTWIADNRLGCPQSGTLPVFPAYALLTAHGTDEATGAVTAADHRTLRATYRLQTTNQNIPGGLVVVDSTKNRVVTLCLDAGSATPATGTVLRAQPCSEPASDRQKFAYGTNLTLLLVSSRTSSNPDGMCVDTERPHRQNNDVYLSPCASPSTSADQQWSFNDNGNFEGTTTDGRDLDGYCLALSNQNTAGTPIVLFRCDTGNIDAITLSPEASVGAGAAGPPVNLSQLVNFGQFGRCLDVTNQDVTEDYLIVWPCKQAPDPNDVTWNQKWQQQANSDGTVRLVTVPGLRYCLRSPGSIAAGAYVRVVSTSCTSSSPPDNLRWRVLGSTGNPETMYRIVDYRGYCLAPTDPDATPPDLFDRGEAVSKVIVATCSGATTLKWNAPASVLDARPLRDLRED
jgi:type II secretory pathway pseudopilin PulG